MPKANPILQTIGLEKRFGGILAAQSVNLTVEPGARHALIGPNGAGKTTVINLLTGVLRPTAGRIELDGRDITRLLPHQRVRLGMARTFQINQLFLDLTPLESIGLVVSERLSAGADWWRLVGTKSAVTEEIVEIVERFRLADVMHERTAILPYGKQRLLEIALAFACRPRVLLLDEPAAGGAAGKFRPALATLAEMRGAGSSCDSPFQARLTRCAATCSSLGLRASSHHWPVTATMPTSICAYIGASFGS